MADNERKNNLIAVFAECEDGQKKVIEKLIDEVVYLEKQMEYFKGLPFIAVHPDNPARQKTTSAAKLYKECSQSYMNAIRILLSLLNKNEVDKKDELMKRLEEFEV